MAKYYFRIPLRRISCYFKKKLEAEQTWLNTRVRDGKIYKSMLNAEMIIWTSTEPIYHLLEKTYTFRKYAKIKQLANG
jgi:hypothetical protein